MKSTGYQWWSFQRKNLHQEALIRSQKKKTNRNILKIGKQVCTIQLKDIMATQEYKMAMDLLTAHDSVIIALHIVVRIIMVIINLIRSE